MRLLTPQPPPAPLPPSPQACALLNDSYNPHILDHEPIRVDVAKHQREVLLSNASTTRQSATLDLAWRVPGAAEGAQVEEIREIKLKHACPRRTWTLEAVAAAGFTEAVLGVRIWGRVLVAVQRGEQRKPVQVEQFTGSSKCPAGGELLGVLERHSQ